MKPSVDSPMAYSFGPFRFETAPYRLSRSGEPVEVTPQQAQLLEILIDLRGEVVSRQMIRKRLWPADVHVDFDRGINFAVARLRLALGDRSEAPQYIETVPRRGYRFVAPLTTPNAPIATEIDAEETNDESADGDHSSQPGSVPTHPRSTLEASNPARLAAAASTVLLLGLVWLGFRQTQAFSQIAVLPKTGPEVIVPKSQAASLSTLPQVPDSGLVNACKVSPLKHQLAPKAAKAFHRGSHFASLPGRADRLKAISALQEVLAHHPEFEPAISCQARLHYRHFDWLRAEPLAKRAMALAPHRAEAHLILAEASFRHHFDWPRAEAQFRAALKKYPHHEELRVAYSSLLSAMGRRQEATRLAQETVELHPLSLFARSELAEELYLAGAFDAAIREAEHVVAIDPRRTDAFFIILQSHMAAGDPTAALARANGMLAYWGWGSAAAADLASFWQLILENRSYRTQVDRDQLSETAAFTLAAGKPEEARRIMERACVERSGWSLPYYNVDPRFRPFHSLPGLRSLSDCLRRPFDLGRVEDPAPPTTP